MKLLIIGGTVFLGRHLVQAALQAGHAVTTFNRGSITLQEQEAAETIYGDRKVSLENLKGRRWDAVIDVCGYEPAIVEKSANFLRDASDSYLFISSISVYKDFSQPAMDEQAPVKSAAEKDYGGLKAGCEATVRAIYGEKAIVVRPGLIVGPYDPTDRFTYWPWRAAAAGRNREILAPGTPERTVQFIDARDLAEWSIRALAAGMPGGIYNATGPDYQLSMGTLLDECIACAGSDAKLRWLNDETLSQAGVEAWSEMPLWIPQSETSMRYFMHVNCARAINSGLTFRPLKDTVTATLEWVRSMPDYTPLKAGLSAEKEAQLRELLPDS